MAHSVQGRVLQHSPMSWPSTLFVDPNSPKSFSSSIVPDHLELLSWPLFLALKPGRSCYQSCTKMCGGRASYYYLELRAFAGFALYHQTPNPRC